MAAMRFLVFGAGFSASEAIAAMRRLEPDTPIAATTRDPAKAERLVAMGIAPHVFDGKADAGLLQAVARATHILVSAGPDAAGDPVLGGLADAIADAPSLCWIGYYSTIGVYGDANGAWIDEDFPTHGFNARIGWRLEAESAWKRLADRKSLPLAILRLAGIYGPGRSGFDKLRNGTARRINKPGQVFNRIHSHDIGEITARAARVRLSGIFNLADDEPAPPQDVLAHAARLLGIDPPAEIDFETADLSPMARSFYAGNRRVCNARIKAALGYGLAFPTYREGLAAILANEQG